MEKSREECGTGFPPRWSHAALSMMFWARKTPTYTHMHMHTHRLCNFLPPMHAVGSSPPLQHQQQQKRQNPDLTPIPEPPKHRQAEKPSEKSWQAFIIGQTL